VQISSGWTSDTHAYEGPGIDPLGDPCSRFVLDYVTDANVGHRPEHRYCTCGWTEAHHAPVA
jgi:hypothetical protein